MRERIKQIIEREGMSQSQFADFIGVNRPTLSHVIAGRNNPSMEIVLKIHQKFPKINILWLLDGIGSYERDAVADYAPGTLTEDLHVDDIQATPQWNTDGSNGEPHATITSPSAMPTTENDISMRFYQGELFAENPIFAAESTAAAKKRKEMPFQMPSKAPYISDTQTDFGRKNLQRKIVEIKIFYDDGTYETFKQ